MNEKLSEWASVAEIVASIGVIVTLVFVGIELNDANREARAATQQMVIKTEMDMVAVFVANAGTWDKVVTGAPIDEGEEMRKAIALYNLAMLETANRYAQYRSGYIDMEQWENNLKSLPAVTRLPIYERWRQSFGGQGQDAAFLELLDSFAAGE